MTAAPQQEMTPIFGAHAQSYLQAGWAGVLYMPVREKDPPPDGLTGEFGRYPAPEEVMQWATQYQHNNIALRMPDDVLGIDVDAYDGKLDGLTLASLEAQLGPLPPTWSSTSRIDDISGIRFFRVPPGMQWKSNIQPHIEIVRRGHRYAMVAPSVHPNGNIYRWYAPGRVSAVVLPRPCDLPYLPLAWIQFLQQSREIWAAGNVDQVRALTDRLIDPDGQPCAYLEKVTQDWVNKIKAAGPHCHDVGRNAAWAVASDGAKFHRGAFTAMARVREAWMQTRVPSSGSAETDWDGRGGAIEPTAWAKAATRIVDQVFEACRCSQASLNSATTTAPAPNPLLQSTSADDRIVDLGPYLDGTYKAPEPIVGAKRNDGVQLLYPGRWHTVVGLTEAGKSLFAIWQAIAVMREGERGDGVVYLHFEETDVRGTLERLRKFGREVGITDELIRTHFVWMNCETPWAEGAFAQALSKLPGRPALVVLDGVNAATAQHGGDVMRPESVEQYKRLFVTPATTLGAAVLSLGHPVKDRTRQGERHSFGSTAWLDVVDGVAFRLEASTHPISKGRKGSSALSSVKDRYGSVKQHGEPTPSKEAGWSYLGSFVVDDSPRDGVEPWHPGYMDRGTEAYLTAPRARKQGAEGSWLDYGSEDAQEGSQAANPVTGDDAAVLALVTEIVQGGKEATGNLIEARAKGLGKKGMGRDRVRCSLERLVDGGSLTTGRGSRNSRLYGLPTSPGAQT